MKYPLIIMLLLLFAFSVRAQETSNAATSSTRDTSTAIKKQKHVKTKIVGGATMISTNDVIANISKSKDHTTFTRAVETAGLTETLKTKGPITVFAPTNKAFEKLSTGRLDTLMKRSHNEELTKLLSYHVISGKYTAKEMAKEINNKKGEAVFTTLSGGKLRARINENRNIVLLDESGNQCVITQLDVEQNNGIIDVTDTVLIPK
jgi:uncharacterized surface protein with fasciclin (FAS1) repeats